MTEIIPYLFFNGEAVDAIDYYAKAFNAEVLNIMKYGNMYDPAMPYFEDVKERVMHGAISIDGKRILFSDNFPNEEKEIDVSVAIVGADAEQLKGYYDALVDDAKEVMVEFQTTEWSPGYGMLRDKYGVKWQLNVETAFE